LFIGKGCAFSNKTKEDNARKSWPKSDINDTSKSPTFAAAEKLQDP
jgi:hypothetical protein